MKVSDLIEMRENSDPTAGQFEGKFLLAMPGIGCDQFERSVIYLCAHSSEGAMGFQVNKSGSLTVGELIERSEIGLVPDIGANFSPELNNSVRNGGPVDEHRGFVLHSDDYHIDATIPICRNVHLTSNVQILRSILDGNGPRQAAVSLGYAGWGAGQLEQEIADNGWLVSPADPDIVFSNDHDNKYEHLLGLMGIDPAHLVVDCGHA